MADHWLWLRALLALSVVMALLGICALLAKWWQQKQPQLFKTGSERRLKILETLSLDAKNKLVLVQCDASQQLLLISPTQSMVVLQPETVSPEQSDS